MTPIVVNTQISYWGAFIGGLLSFFSPCIFPILPGFLAFLVSSQKSNTAVSKAVAFSIGLSIIFIMLGFASGAFGSFLTIYKRYVEIIGGIIIVIFGISYTGLFTLPFFEKGIYIPFKRDVDNFWSAILFGVVTAFAWTPCIGPVLGTILTIAATGNTISGGILLSVFSFGLVTPLILASFLIQIVNKIVGIIVKYQKLINFVGGIVLVLFGILMIFGKLAILA